MDGCTLPDVGVVFCIRQLPVAAFEPRAFLRLAPPAKDLILQSSKKGLLLLDAGHLGMVFVHGVRFDALTDPVSLDGKGAVFPDEFATGSGFGYVLDDPAIHVPRDRDAVAENKLLKHLASVLLESACDSSEVQGRIWDLLLKCPNGLESRVVRWSMQHQAYRQELLALGRASLGELRHRHGAAAFAVDRPLQNMDLDSLSAAGLVVVDLSRSPVLGTLLRNYGGHPDLGTALGNARDRAEKAAVEVQLDPAVRQSVDTAAAELGRAAGVMVRVRAVDGPKHLVRRHVRATAVNVWHATIHRDLLEPSSIHRRLGGVCAARNRQGQCSCAFVAAVREILVGAKESGVLNLDREQALLWSMLALGAAAGGASGEQASKPPDGPEQPIAEKETGGAQRDAAGTANSRGVEQLGQRQRRRTPADSERFRRTQPAGEFLPAGSLVVDPAPSHGSGCCRPAALALQRDSSLLPWGSSVGLFLEAGSEAARRWAQEHPHELGQFLEALAAVVSACRLVGDGVQGYVAGEDSALLAFNQGGSIFVSARAFAEVSAKLRTRTEAADRVFGWVKHELAHNDSRYHDLQFVCALEEISSCLDSDWFHSDERSLLAGEISEGGDTHDPAGCRSQ